MYRKLSRAVYPNFLTMPSIFQTSTAGELLGYRRYNQDIHEWIRYQSQNHQRICANTWRILLQRNASTLAENWRKSAVSVHEGERHSVRPYHISPSEQNETVALYSGLPHAASMCSGKRPVLPNPKIPRVLGVCPQSDQRFHRVWSVQGPILLQYDGDLSFERIWRNVTTTAEQL